MVQKINPHPAPGCNRSLPPTMFFQKIQFLGVFHFFRSPWFILGFGFFNDFYLILIFRGSRSGSCFYDCNCTWLHFTFSRWILWQRRNCHFLHAFYLLFMDQKCQNRTNLLGSPMVSIDTYSNIELIFFSLQILKAS